MPRVSFAKYQLDNLSVPAVKAGVVAQVDYFDESMPGFGLRVSSNNVRTWFYLTRLHGRVRRFTIGRAQVDKDGPGLRLAEARANAVAMARQVGEGDDPGALARAARKAKAEAAEAARRAAAGGANDQRDKSARRLYHNVVASYVEVYAKPNTRRWKDTKKILEKYTVPEWGDREIDTIRRLEIAELLDKVEANSGRVTSNHVLAVVRAMMNWFARRDDDFVVPIVPGMAKGKISRRERILNDAEIKAVWGAVPDHVFGAIVKLLFLTAQRRSEVAAMRWEDIDEGASGGPLWTIPEDAYKTGVTQTVPLSAAALAVIKAQKRVDKCPYVFSTNHKTPFQGFSKMKTSLDDKAGVNGWVLHDIRRTARTLMARAKIPMDTAERVIGHVQSGIVRTYDRHEYDEEKRAALESYEVLLNGIISERTN